MSRTRSRTMTRITAAIVAIIIATAAQLARPAPAQADNGDWGNLNHSCDYYEICFNALSHTIWYSQWGIGHAFYWGDMSHHDELLCTSEPINASCGYMVNWVEGFWNRDSSCYVRLWDIVNGAWTVYAQLPIGYRGDVGFERNDGHSRC